MSRLTPFNPRPYRIALHLALVVGTILGGLPFTALAQTYNPPEDIGLPGRREGGGTRGCWRSDTTFSTTDRLTALVPDQNFGYTTSEYPTFFVYVPQFYAENAVAAEFILNDEDDNELYKATFQTGGTSGIISLSLPANANLPPLEVGKNYHWSFALVCEMSDRSADVVVDSWIQRVELDATVRSELERASLEQHPTILAQEGIWYDAISSLAALRSQSGGPVPASQWVNLLNSVGLVHITRETPIERVNLSLSNPTLNLGQ